MTNPTIPEWVHMAEVPPPTDDEPWTYQPEAAARRRSGLIATACILAILALAALAVWGTGR